MQESIKEKLLMHMGGISSVSDIIRNPFFLLCICFAAASGKDVPSQRIDILRQVQTRLLEHFIKKQFRESYRIITYLKKSQRGGINIFDSIYSRLAFHNSSQLKLDFSEPQIISLTEDIAREYNVSQYQVELSEAVLNCGILAAGRQKNYSFTHQIFMEYFAAQELSRRADWNEILLKRYPERSWKNVILFFIALSGASKFPEIYKLLIQHDDYFHKGLLLAAESIKELAEYPPQTQEIIEQLYKISNKHPLRDYLIGSLIYKHRRHFLTGSKPILGTDHQLDRVVVESLVKRGKEPYLDKCVDLILGDVPDDAFGLSIKFEDSFKQMVGQYGGQIKFDTLADILLHHTDQHLSAACAFFLSLISTEQAEAKLIEAILKRKNEYIRIACIAALRNIGSSRAIEVLMPILTNDKDDPGVRKECAKALGKLGNQKASEKLVEVLENPEEKHIEVRIACAEALGQIGAADGLSPLIRGLIHEPEISFRVECAKALGKFGGEKAAERMAELLTNPKEDTAVRIACAEGLGEIRLQKYSPILAKILARKNCPNIQYECARALAFIDQKLAKEILFTLLVKPKGDAYLRGICATLLREIRSPQVDKLRRFLADPYCDSGLRYEFIKELGKSGLPEVPPELIHILNHRHEPWIRQACMFALGQIGTDESLARLVEEVLTSKDNGIRWYCITTISMMKQEYAPLVLARIAIELQQRNENELAMKAIIAMAEVVTEVSLDLSILVFRGITDQVQSLLDDTLSHFHWLLKGIYDLSNYLNRIVSPQSLYLRDVSKERDHSREPRKE